MKKPVAKPDNDTFSLHNYDAVYRFEINIVGHVQKDTYGQHLKE